MIRTFSALALAAALCVPTATALADKHYQERVDHYAVETKPKTIAEARALLHAGTAAIADATRAANLEQVHEQTYTVEAALEVLNASTNPKEKAMLETFAFVLEKIHLASEDGKAEVITVNLPILQFIATEYQKAFQ